MNANGRELKSRALPPNHLIRICVAVLALVNAVAQTLDSQLPPDVYRNGHGVTAPQVA
ncbi:MAG TPA: hypothetical protein VLY24_00125 [Bryobacteraceae bacterium]|nr:hypothetical protein [Bryobacteraceae bacterium]